MSLSSKLHVLFKLCVTHLERGSNLTKKFVHCLQFLHDKVVECGEASNFLYPFHDVLLQVKWHHCISEWSGFKSAHTNKSCTILAHCYLQQREEFMLKKDLVVRLWYTLQHIVTDLP